MSCYFRALLLGGLLSIPVVSMATHEVDHRYRIFGTVQNSDGAPIADSRVRLTGLGGRPLGETVTDKSGGYEFRLHVHNQDLGTRFWVSANGVTQEGALTFDPADKVTERMHRIDLSKNE